MTERQESGMPPQESKPTTEVDVKEFIEKAKTSEYWDKPLPGVTGWTVGDTILTLADKGLLKIDEDTAEKVYNGFLHSDSVETDEEAHETRSERLLVTKDDLEEILSLAQGGRGKFLHTSDLKGSRKSLELIEEKVMDLLGELEDEEE